MESTPAGQSYTTTVSAPSSSGITVTVNGQPVFPSIRSLGGDDYEITVSAADVQCPGPIVISGLNGPDKKVKLTGCPQ